VAILLALTRIVVDLVATFCNAVERGRVQLAAFHPETIGATRRVFTILAWGLGIALAYPYLPGASSDAFKGLSVLFGLMLTLGSTGLVTQAMSGLVVVYSRALRKGGVRRGGRRAGSGARDHRTGGQDRQHPQRGDHGPELGAGVQADLQ
jgi:hypothetical protein